MKRRTPLVLAAAVIGALAACLAPAEAQDTGSVPRFLTARSFVRDSVAPVRVTALRPGVISMIPNRVATPLQPAALRGQLQAREIRVERVSSVAERPRVAANDALQWKVPLEIKARDNHGVTHTLRPHVEMIGAGLEWDRTLGRYIGKVRVWLEDQIAPASGYALEAPVAIEVGGEASDYDPPRWDVPNAGFPSKDVQIVVAGARPRDTIQIKVAATTSGGQVALEEATAAIRMPLSGEPMTIRPVHQSVQGWGLENAELTITTSPSTSGQRLQVSVTSARGMTRAQSIPIDSLGHAIARIRSGTPGRDTIWVNLENRYMRFALVDHQPPWIFLLFAVGGGLVGSFLRTLGRPPSRSKHPVRAFLIQQVIGVLCGIVTMGLYHVGFPILPAIATGQSGGILTGVVAAVGAFLGRDRLAKVLGEG